MGTFSYYYYHFLILRLLSDRPESDKKYFVKSAVQYPQYASDETRKLLSGDTHTAGTSRAREPACLWCVMLIAYSLVDEIRLIARAPLVVQKYSAATRQDDEPRLGIQYSKSMVPYSS